MQNTVNQNRCIALGDFDGVHLGHQRVISEMVKISITEGIEPTIIYFDLPQEIRQQEKYLSTNKEKDFLLKKYGIKNIVKYKLKKHINKDNAEKIITEIINMQPSLKYLISGRDYKYINILREYSKKYSYKLIECDSELYEGEIINSERIADSLSKGLLESTKNMLGHPYLFIGEVIRGKGLGRTAGMPTTNIAYKPWKLLPTEGVYSSQSKIEGRIIQGLTNIGRRPSVDDDSNITIETFFLDFTKTLYGVSINLEILEFIRQVKKFKNIEAVKKQIDKDIKKIKKL